MMNTNHSLIIKTYANTDIVNESLHIETNVTCVRRSGRVASSAAPSIAQLAAPRRWLVAETVPGRSLNRGTRGTLRVRLELRGRRDRLLRLRPSGLPLEDSRLLRSAKQYCAVVVSLCCSIKM